MFCGGCYSYLMNQLPDLLLSEKNPIPCAGKVAQDTKYLAITAWNSKYLIMGQAQGKRQKAVEMRLNASLPKIVIYLMPVLLLSEIKLNRYTFKIEITSDFIFEVSFIGISDVLR